METVLVLVVLLCACTSLSSACSCFPERGPAQFCKYDLIFRGTAVAEYEEREEPLDHSDPFWEYNPFRDWVYTVRVDLAIVMPEELSGAKNVSIRTRMQSNLCGIRFPLDVDALFFARVNDKGEIMTGLCDPNTPWEALSAWESELITDHLVDICSSMEDKEVTPPEP